MDSAATRRRPAECPPAGTASLGDAPTSRVAFTLIELMVVIAIVFALMGLLLPALSLVRRQAAVASARQTVRQVTMSLDSYRSGDAEHRYPPPQADCALALRAPSPGSSAVLALLERHGLPPLKAEQLDDRGRLLDPWGQPIRFVVVRPVVSDPASLANWNYDAANGHERSWGRRWDAAAGAIADGALPFPYVYSLGPSGRTDLGAGWIYAEDAKP
jgi:type II secretory pathway pseudopilin PulG